MRPAFSSVEIKLAGALRAFVVAFLRTLDTERREAIWAGTSFVTTTHGICDTRPGHKFNPSEGIAVRPRFANRSFKEESDITFTTLAGIVFWAFDTDGPNTGRTCTDLHATTSAVGFRCAIR